MKHLLLVSLLLIFSQISFAQAPTRFQIQGIAMDTASNPLGFATVMLLQRKDSSLVNYIRTNEKGLFLFKNIKKGDYLLKISYVGYIPFQKDVLTANEENIELGILKLKPITKELFEVVVKTARAPLTIKGDTIEYNAASFKVPPGSTVEDLLRKLPGVLVDQNGNITAQGKEVKKVLVDGKTFFGDDPKQATKNLPAEAVTKVQVFNDKTEQSKITGVDDGKKEKAINLQLKDEFKKGGFGKVTAGIGNIERGEIKGNYNKFNDKNQIALVGLANNTNQTGMSWNDYQDFRGSNAFQWGDDGDFGFSSGGRFFSFGDDGEDGGGLNIPIGGDRGRGFSKNYAGGINYNFDTKKTKLSSSYYYNSTKQDLDAIRTRQNFLSSGIYNTNEKSFQSNFNGNHRASLRFEKMLDSLNSIIVKTEGRLNNGDALLQSTTNQSSSAGQKISDSQINNQTQINRFDLANTLIYRLKFKKKGRSFAASATYVINNSNGAATQQSTNQFYQATTVNQVLGSIYQQNETDTKRTQLKSSLLFVEPLSKKIFWESFYNFAQRNDKIDRNVNNLKLTEQPRIDSLSAYYNNDITYNRIGTGLRYTFKGTNVSLGGAWQQINLKGQFANSNLASAKLSEVNKIFTTWVPNFSFSKDLKNNKYIYSEYNVSLQQPAIKDLQPIINNANPLYIQQGNPNLIPQLDHRANIGFSYFNPGSFVNMYVDVNYTYHSNQIVYSQNIDPKTLITTTKPENISGGKNIGTYFNASFPIVKTKSTLSFGGSSNFGNNLSYINSILNETNTKSYSIRTRLDLTPSDNFTLYANANLGISNTEYSINKAQNQQIFNNNYSVDMNFKLPKDFYINSNFNYRTYINDRFGFDQKIPIWNISAYHFIGKSKKAEVRLSAYDVFNKNLGVSQYASQNFVSEERVVTLAQYFMLSFTYNMRGIKAQMKKQQYF